MLVYHSIAETEADPWSLRVRPSHFAEHLEVLRRFYRPVPIKRMADDLRTRKLSHRSVAITFDDGYADNLHCAKPLLEDAEIPAMFFLATDHLGSERRFWWDELEHLLLRQGALPEQLALEIEGNPLEWSLGDGAQYSQSEVSRFRNWRSWDDPPTPRHALYRALYEVMRPLANESRQHALDQLADWAGAASMVGTCDRVLSLEEVVTLADGDLIEIGAHTKTHPVLSQIPATQQRFEIRKSKNELEKTLNRPVQGFAYPYGGASDYSAETVAIVRETGFDYACSVSESVVSSDTDSFQIPRFMVGNWNGEEFSRRLSQFVGD